MIRTTLATLPVAVGLVALLGRLVSAEEASRSVEPAARDPAWEAVWRDAQADAQIRALVRLVDAHQMRRNLFYLSKDPLPYRKLNFTLPGHEKNTLYEADDFLAGQLEAWGYRVDREGVQVQAYRRDERKSKHAQYASPRPEDPWYTAYNLYAEKRGSACPEEILLALAHKDSQSWVDSPGANDNAIGTCGVLELARVLAAYPARRTLRFLFCNEEHTPWTSVTAAEKAKARGDRIVAVFNLDGIGVKSPEDTAAGKKLNVTGFTTPEGQRLAVLMHGVNEQFGLGLEQRSVQRPKPGDDDGSFVRAGYLAAVINIGSWPYADPNYHAEGDIPERTDVDNAALTVQATLAAILTLDRLPASTPVATAGAQTEAGPSSADALRGAPPSGPPRADVLPGDRPRGDSPGGDLLRFLPNDGNSVYPAKGLLRAWGPGGPKELWRLEVGYGKSAVVEAKGLAFTAAETEDKQWALALDPATGTVRWKRLLLAKPNRHFEWGPVTSPVVDEDRVYFIPYDNYQGDVWEVRCPIVCLTTDGTELWRVDQGVWASEACTPLVVGDMLYVGADSPERVVLAALDKRTGAVRWTTKLPSPRDRELAAPASLSYQVVGGIPQVIVATYGTREVLGVHAGTGQIMWRYAYPADIILGLISTPVVVGSRVFLSAGEGKGRDFSACLEMAAEDGRITFREVYQSFDLQTNLFNTPAIWQGLVFGFGGGSRAGFLHCTRLEDGRLLWKQASRDWANDRNLCAADGLLFAITKNDELVLAEASAEGYRKLGRVRPGIELGRPQQPTIANGRLYLRGNRWVVCYHVGP